MFGDWLLCDFHIHTKFSDGFLLLPDVIDLYGEHGFDAICITDHILDSRESERRKRLHEPMGAIEPASYPEYLHSIEAEAQRAWKQYKMLVMPGAEMTNNTMGYHILGLDIREYIDPDLAVQSIVQEIHLQKGLAIAPHPYRGRFDGTQKLMYVWEHLEQFKYIFDAWEVANRNDLFLDVVHQGLNLIANSDFHETRHIFSWKSLLKAEKLTGSIKESIRDNHTVSLYWFVEQAKHYPLGINFDNGQHLLRLAEV